METLLITIIAVGVISIGGLYGMHYYEKYQNKKWARACADRNVNPR